MLTICRSLMGCPKLIMIDEPTEGLSPQMVGNVEKLLKKIAEKGVSILLVEQKLTIAFNLSKRLFIMGHGKVVYEGEIISIFREKNAVKEVKNGLECGISLKDFIDFKEKDIIESYQLEKIERTI